MAYEDDRRVMQATLHDTGLKTRQILGHTINVEGNRLAFTRAAFYLRIGHGRQQPLAIGLKNLGYALHGLSALRDFEGAVGDVLSRQSLPHLDIQRSRTGLMIVNNDWHVTCPQVVTQINCILGETLQDLGV